MEGQGGECGGGEQMVVRNEGVEGVDNVFRAHGGDAATEGESDQASKRTTALCSGAIMTRSCNRNSPRRN